MSRHPVAALALALAMTGAIASCGVQPTGVVDAGEPAKGPLPPVTVDSEAPPAKREVGPRLYFVIGGDLQPVVRAGLPAGDPNVALAALLKGPSDVELKRGMITALPRDLGQLRLGRRTVSTVTVILDADPRRLRRLAMLQITCTLAFALPDRLPIVLVGPDGGSLAAPRCIERAPFLVEVPPT